MSKRTLLILLVLAALFVGSAVAVRGHGGGAFSSWFQRIHGH
jgi:hypothetical protein